MTAGTVATPAHELAGGRVIHKNDPQVNYQTEKTAAAHAR